MNNKKNDISNDALRTLAERGFIQQCSDLTALNKRMNEEALTFYVGIDPTGPSLHVGHMVPVFAAAHLARQGHRAILLIGGGTSLIGDPSGKSEIRKMIDAGRINQNAENIKQQLQFFFQQLGIEVEFENNADWLVNLKYIEFLRDIGKHFSVNRMLSFEAYRTRMERGLSFIEFNYQLLQSYDFLELHRRKNCELQIGGDDQWGNIVAGIDLIRRMESSQGFGLTFPLITRSDGKKMGKTEKGAVFLDARLFSPFDFFQYWRNVTDSDTLSFLKIFTFLSLDEISEMVAEKDTDINKAKEALAYEFTALVHGREIADGVLEAAHVVFSGGGSSLSSALIYKLPAEELEAGIGLLELFTRCGLCTSRGEARRLVQQGGAYMNGRRLENTEEVVSYKNLCDNGIILRAGKKRYMRVGLE